MVEASMSEYQLYEFLALDRPLSAEDLAYVRTLSSRVQPTPSQATFTYAYGDFPGDPLKLLAKHYDMMLYLANWGTKQLAFRFPKAAAARSGRGAAALGIGRGAAHIQRDPS
jgi:hypothetical protein